MEFGLVTIIHAVLALLAVIELGLSAWFVAATDISHLGLTAPSQPSFILFCSIWSLLVLAFLFLTPRYAPSLSHVFVVLGLVALTVLFWFAGAIALAVVVGANATARACVAFAFFLWAGFTGLLVLELISWRKGSSSLDGHHHGGPKPATYPGA